MCEDDDDWNPFDRGGLDIGEPANEVASFKELRVAHDQVQRSRALEARVDGVVFGVSTEVPEIDSDPLRLEAEEVGATVPPF